MCHDWYRKDKLMTELTPKLVEAVGNAFNANDIDAVMQYFAPNAIFDHAVGAAVSYTHLTLPTN